MQTSRGPAFPSRSKSGSPVQDESRGVSLQPWRGLCRPGFHWFRRNFLKGAVPPNPGVQPGRSRAVCTRRARRLRTRVPVVILGARIRSGRSARRITALPSACMLRIVAVYAFQIQLPDQEVEHGHDLPEADTFGNAISLQVARE